MSDSRLEVVHFVRTQLALKRFHIEVGEEGSEDRLALDAILLHAGGIDC